jgi:glycosyltransferase involved in cell wall biosynthesis
MNSERKLHWEVNWLIVRDGIYYGFGWVFHEEQKILDLRLKVRFENGESQTIAASFGKPRDDVAASFAEFVTAKFAGFSVLGSCEQEMNKSSNLLLLVTIEDGSVFEFPIPQNCVKSFGADEIAAGRISRRQLVTYVKRGIFLLGSLQITNLLGYVKRYFRSRPAAFLEEGEALRSRLDAAELRYIVLVIDHDFGGGANLYREQMVAEKIAEGATVLILSFYVATLSYVLIVRSNQRNERFAIPGCNFLLKLAGLIEIKEVIYNTGVSFAHPEELPPLIVKLKITYRPHLTLLVHDFFMVCPSHYLLDDAGKYCGIPDMSRCQICLVNNQQDFSSLFQSRNMVEWRALWGSVIGLADEVRTFSNDSLKLLQKAYPALEPSRVVVKPHVLKHLRHGIIQPSYTASLRIGVVGQIGYHKGAKVVQELAYEIKARKLDIQIVVIGKIEAQCEQTVVRQTGLYQHDKLPTLIDSSGVNIMLFPSIWPETFSYVVQELIEMGLPVACFDLGAPAERLSNYAKGMILKETTAPATLDSLILFHQRVYPRAKNDQAS